LAKKPRSVPRAPAAARRRAPRPALGRPLGAHQSVAGGFDKAVERAVETGCECLQIFTRNVNRWDAAPIPAADAARFRAAVEAAGLAFVVAHDSYLINPAAADDALRGKSIDGLALELARAAELGIRWVVAHPGAAGSQDRATAVDRAGRGIAAALARTAGLDAGILVETTAGQGSCLGDTFEEVAAIVRIVDEAGFAARVGVCLDTCHVFAAGYPLAPRADYEATIDAFDRAVGLGRLVAIHANDSKKPRGSRVDRHEAIGAGCIGPEAFALLLADPRLERVPVILETPKEGDDGKVDPEQDRRNLAALRRAAARSRR